MTVLSLPLTPVCRGLGMPQPCTVSWAPLYTGMSNLGWGGGVGRGRRRRKRGEGEGEEEEEEEERRRGEGEEILATGAHT